MTWIIRNVVGDFWDFEWKFRCLNNSFMWCMFSSILCMREINTFFSLNSKILYKNSSVRFWRTPHKLKWSRKLEQWKQTWAFRCNALDFKTFSRSVLLMTSATSKWSDYLKLNERGSETIDVTMRQDKRPDSFTKHWPYVSDCSTRFAFNAISNRNVFNSPCRMSQVINITFMICLSLLVSK